MKDIRGCIASVSKLHATRMKLYSKEVLTEDDVDTLNTIDKYLDTLRKIVKDQKREYTSAIHRKRGLFEYQEGVRA